MIIDNTRRIKVKFDDNEKLKIKEVIKLLYVLSEKMEDNEVECLECNHKYTYDISDVNSVTDTLEKFLNLNEFFA